MGTAKGKTIYFTKACLHTQLLSIAIALFCGAVIQEMGLNSKGYTMVHFVDSSTV